MSAASGGVSVRAGPGPGERSRKRRLPRKHRPRPRDPGGPEARTPGHALVCGGCGRLGWPDDAAARQPHRRDGADDGMPRDPCRSCGQRSWIDLGRESTALMLRQQEEHDEEARVTRPRRVVRDTLLGGTVGALFGFPLLGGLGGVLLMIFTAMLVGSWTLRQQRRLDLRPALPSRWAMALPPAGVVTEVRQGPARARGDTLVAPLSGRRCVAYEVGVRHDHRGTEPAGTWTLLEQRVAVIEVGGHAVEPEATHLVLPRQHLGSRSTVELDEAAEAYLRQRGLGSKAATLELFEGIVEADAEVRLELTGQGARLRLG